MQSIDCFQYFDILLANIEPYDVYLYKKPYDAVVILKNEVIVEKIVTLADDFDIDSSVLDSVMSTGAEVVYKGMPFCSDMLTVLSRLGVKTICIGKQTDEYLKGHALRLGINYMHGLAEEDLSRINRYWLKKKLTGTPYVIKLYVMGMDGKAIDPNVKKNEFSEFDELFQIFSRCGTVCNISAIPLISKALLESDTKVKFTVSHSSPFGQGQAKSIPNTSSDAIWAEDELISTNSLVWCSDVARDSDSENIPGVDEVITLIVPCLNGVYHQKYKTYGVQTGLVGNSWMINVRK